MAVNGLKSVSIALWRCATNLQSCQHWQSIESSCLNGESDLVVVKFPDEKKNASSFYFGQESTTSNL